MFGIFTDSLHLPHYLDHACWDCALSAEPVQPDAICLWWLPITMICQHSPGIFVKFSASEWSYFPQGYWESLYVKSHQYLHYAHASCLFSPSKNVWVLYPPKLSLYSKNAWVLCSKKLAAVKMPELFSKKLSLAFKVVFSQADCLLYKTNEMGLPLSLHLQIMWIYFK